LKPQQNILDLPAALVRRQVSAVKPDFEKFTVVRPQFRQLRLYDI
jgi:hypothetical protein